MERGYGRDHQKKSSFGVVVKPPKIRKKVEG
jgi:hypothetical protein